MTLSMNEMIDICKQQKKVIVGKCLVKGKLQVLVLIPAMRGTEETVLSLGLDDSEALILSDKLKEAATRDSMGWTFEEIEYAS